MKFDLNKLRTAVLNTHTREQWESAGRGVDNSSAIFFQYPNEVPIGEYFLCDCIGNTINLCKSTKRKFKNADGRLVRCKVIETIIPDCHAKFGTALNGCWVIPSNCQ